MSTATFVVESQDQKSILVISKEIGDFVRLFATTKELNTVTTQQVCALIAAFVKKGDGTYEVFSTNEESSDGEEENEPTINSSIIVTP